jgi:hypothetical protein
VVVGCLGISVRVLQCYLRISVSAVSDGVPCVRKAGKKRMDVAGEGSAAEVGSPVI